MSNENYVLNEINKGIKMGMDSISNVSQKVQDDRFKQDLKCQYDKYNQILNNVNDELSNYDAFPKELNPMQKAMGWMSIEMNTISDKSNSKIAEMMLQGTNMGIIEGVKLRNQYPDLDKPVQNILNEFVQFQQNNVEQLKKYRALFKCKEENLEYVKDHFNFNLDDLIYLAKWMEYHTHKNYPSIRFLESIRGLK